MSTTDLVTVAAEQLAAARQAHADVVANHRDALSIATRARDRHTAAAAQREKLLKSAADGVSVTEGDLKAADAAAADCLNTLDLHRNVAAGAQTKVEQAEIAVMHAQVADHSARTDAARIAVLTAAAAVDQAIAEARAKLAAYQDRLAALGVLDDEARAYLMHQLPVALTRNTVLASLHPSAHPKPVAVGTGRPDLTIALLTGARPGSLERAHVVHGLEQYSSGLAPKTPTPAPATKAA